MDPVVNRGSVNCCIGVPGALPTAPDARHVCGRGVASGCRCCVPPPLGTIWRRLPGVARGRVHGGGDRGARWTASGPSARRRVRSMVYIVPSRLS